MQLIHTMTMRGFGVVWLGCMWL